MPKCPKCGREIDTLLNYETGCQTTEVKTDKDGELQWNVTSFNSDKDDNDLDKFLCPLCFEALFTDADEVIEFLKGE